MRALFSKQTHVSYQIDVCKRTKTMSEKMTKRFQIYFDPWYRVLSFLVGIPPSGSYIEFSEDQVKVRMSWAFRSRFPRSAVSEVSVVSKKPLSRGVHGFCGRWLVNGSERIF